MKLNNGISFNFAISKSFQQFLRCCCVLAILGMTPFASNAYGQGTGGGGGSGSTFELTDFTLTGVTHSHGQHYTLTYHLAKNYDRPERPFYFTVSAAPSDSAPLTGLTQGSHTISDANLGMTQGEVTVMFCLKYLNSDWRAVPYLITIDENGDIDFERKPPAIGVSPSIGQHYREPHDAGGCSVGNSATQGASVIRRPRDLQSPSIQLPNALTVAGSGCSSCTGDSIRTGSLLTTSFQVMTHNAVMGGSLGGGNMNIYDSNAYVIDFEGTTTARLFFDGVAYTCTNLDASGVFSNIHRAFKKIQLDAATLAASTKLMVTAFDGTAYEFSLFESGLSDQDPTLDQNGRLTSIKTPNGRDTTLSYGDTDPAVWTSITDAFGNTISAVRSSYVAGHKAISQLNINSAIYNITYQGHAIESITGSDWQWNNTTSFDPLTQTLLMEITSVEHGLRKYRFLPDHLIANNSVIGQPVGVLVSVHDGNNENIFSVFPNPNNPTLQGGPEFILYWGDERKAAIYKVGEYLRYLDPVEIAPGALDWNSFDLTKAEPIYAWNQFGTLSGSSLMERWLLGAPEQTRDRTGTEYTYEYDNDWFVTKKTLVTSGTAPFEEYTYNQYKQPLTYTDTRGNVTTYEYNLNNMTKMTVGGPGATGTPVAPVGIYEYEYGPAGQVSKAKDALYPSGSSTATVHVTEWQFDANNRIVKKIEAADVEGRLRAKTTITYHANGGVATITDPLNRVTTYGYDAAGRRTSTTYHDNSTEIRTFGATGTADVGRLIKSKDRVGSTTWYEYDALGRNWKTTRNYEKRDAAGQLIQVNDQLDWSWVTRYYLSGSSIVEYKIENGKRTDYVYDYRDRRIETKVRPYAGKELVTKMGYENNQLLYTEDSYGRRTYNGYSTSDPTKKIRHIQCLVPGVVFNNVAEVLNATRVDHPDCLISDAVRDTEGNLIEVVDPRGVAALNTYDTRNQQVTSTRAAVIYNEFGEPIATNVPRKTETIYDANGNVIETRSPRYFDEDDNVGSNKARTTYTYNGRNLKHITTFAPGTNEQASTEVTYTLDGRQATRKDESGFVWQTDYHNCCGRFLGSRDPLGHGRIANTDFEGRVTHSIVVENYDSHLDVQQNKNGSHDPMNSLTHGEITTLFDGLGRTRATTRWLVARDLIDANDVPIAGMDGVTSADGLTTQMVYDNNLADGYGLDGDGVTIDKLDGSGTYDLNIANVLAKLTSETGYSFTTDESAGSATVSINGAEEISVSISDAAGRTLISATLQPHNGATAFELVSWQTNKLDQIYTSGNVDFLETWSVNAVGDTTKSRTDGAGRVVQSVVVVGGVDKVTTMTYDAQSNVLSSLDPNGVGQVFAVYDELGQQTSKTDSWGLTTSSNYDHNGNLISTTDANSNVVTMKYDVRDRRIKTIDRLAGETDYEYRDTGQVIKIIDAEDKETVYTFNDRGEKTAEQYPDHVNGAVEGATGYGIVKFEYDPAGRMLRRTAQTGNTVTLNYDLAGRLKLRDYRLQANSPSGTIEDSDIYTYDAASRMLTAESERYNNTVTRVYDDGGRLKTDSLAIDNRTYTVTSGYNDASQLTDITYPDGTLVERSYNDRGLLHQVKYAGSVIDTRTYDDGGRLDISTYGNGVITDYDYRSSGNNADNLISQITTTSFGNNKVGTYSYSWDNNRNKTAETITGGGPTNNYGFSTGANGYDLEDRLINWNRTDGNQDQSWNLSLVGDFNSFTENSTVQNRTHNEVHETTAINDNTIDYDAKGNLTTLPGSVSPTGNTQVFNWDMDNRLSSIDKDNDGTIDNIARYDALGRRVKWGSPTAPKTYVYFGQQVITRYNDGTAPASPIHKWVYGSYIDEPIMMDRLASSSWKKYYYSRNQQYSITALTNNSGYVQERYAYDAYGNTTIMNKTGTVLTSSALNNPFMYTGRFYHSGLGIYYFRARMYSPMMGRFVSRDPLGYVDGMSLYRAYFVPAGMDPLGFKTISSKITWRRYMFRFRVPRNQIDDQKDEDTRIKVSLTWSAATKDGRNFKRLFGTGTFKVEPRWGLIDTDGGRGDTLYKKPGDRISNDNLVKEKDAQHCVECGTLDGHVTFYREIKKPYLSLFKGMSSLLVAKLIPGDGWRDAIGSSLFKLATNEILENRLTDDEFYQVAFLLIICADGKRAGGIYNLPGIFIRESNYGTKAKPGPFVYRHYGDYVNINGRFWNPPVGRRFYEHAN